MMMTKKLSEIMAQLPEDRQAKIKAKAEQLLSEIKSEEILLQNICQAQQLTKEKIKEVLGVDQEGIFTIEKQTDLLLSTLKNYLNNMGGDLKIIVEFPEHNPLIIDSLTEIDTK
jgi:hypothetical protein